jgi:hypothetical protein
MSHELLPDVTPPWDIRREGRAWREEALDRLMLAPEKFEMWDGKLFWSDEARITLLALLLENLGVDAAVRIGDPAVWRAAIAALDAEDGG